MARDGEILGMSASGVSPRSVLMPLALLGLAVVAIQLAVAEFVVPRTNTLAAATRDEITGLRDVARTGAPPAYIRRGGDFYTFSAYDGRRGPAGRLTIHRMNQEGRPTERIDADAAVHVGEGAWRLEQPTSVGFEHDLPRQMDPPSVVELPEYALHLTDPRRLSAAQVRREIHATEAAGFDARWLRVDLWSRLTGPLAVLLFPIIIALIALRSPPHPPISLLVAAGAALAALYAVTTGIAVALATGGSLPAPLSAVGPGLLLVLLLVPLSLQAFMWPADGSNRFVRREAPRPRGRAGDPDR